MDAPIFPTLTTERITLRQLSIDDNQAIFELRTDAEVNKYLNRQPCKSIEDAKKFINTINENIEKEDTFYWAICLTDTKQLVGTICLFDFWKEKRSCEIGYELMTKFQGQGIMHEATQTVINFVFETLKLKKIFAFTDLENQNSIKLLLKLNFKKSIEVDKENPNLVSFTLVK